MALRGAPRRLFRSRRHLKGHLDHVSDEELARLYPDREEDHQRDRPCSRCEGELLLYWHGPLMTGVWMELCPACDARRPAARAFIQWYRDPDRDPKALPKLFEDWEAETLRLKSPRCADARGLLVRAGEPGPFGMRPSV
ncbi:hypothetical protein AR457_40590 [Streptomyces agglomeratus]|uniref:DUF6300 family protein n=1 Tax=Streptomyces agglomeratus TaxID=285458 RepID=UPI0008527C08|nr:DUF6300 family protein [Streptomyces agglomeratus]OEJ22171.1 hypothetical protein AR457_40590 [Streptomyces agglomeratus]OEJ37008.1 hypothetical protein BGK70_01240 [Streptomyces agglomeratus]